MKWVFISKFHIEIVIFWINELSYVKFRYSEKAANFLKKYPNFLTSNAAFSEYLNLNVNKNGIPSNDREQTTFFLKYLGWRSITNRQGKDSETDPNRKIVIKNSDWKQENIPIR